MSIDYKPLSYIKELMQDSEINNKEKKKRTTQKHFINYQKKTCP